MPPHNLNFEELYQLYQKFDQKLSKKALNTPLQEKLPIDPFKPTELVGGNIFLFWLIWQHPSEVPDYLDKNGSQTNLNHMNELKMTPVELALFLFLTPIVLSLVEAGAYFPLNWENVLYLANVSDDYYDHQLDILVQLTLKLSRRVADYSTRLHQLETQVQEMKNQLQGKDSSHSYSCSYSYTDGTESSDSEELARPKVSVSDSEEKPLFQMPFTQLSFRDTNLPRQINDDSCISMSPPPTPPLIDLDGTDETLPALIDSDEDSWSSMPPLEPVSEVRPTPPQRSASYLFPLPPVPSGQVPTLPPSPTLLPLPPRDWRQSSTHDLNTNSTRLPPTLQTIPEDDGSASYTYEYDDGEYEYVSSVSSEDEEFLPSQKQEKLNPVPPFQKPTTPPKQVVYGQIVLNSEELQAGCLGTLDNGSLDQVMNGKVLTTIEKQPGWVRRGVDSQVPQIDTFLHALTYVAPKRSDGTYQSANDFRNQLFDSLKTISPFQPIWADAKYEVSLDHGKLDEYNIGQCTEQLLCFPHRLLVIKPSQKMVTVIRPLENRHTVMLIQYHDKYYPVVQALVNQKTGNLTYQTVSDHWPTFPGYRVQVFQPSNLKTLMEELNEISVFPDPNDKLDFYLTLYNLSQTHYDFQTLTQSLYQHYPLSENGQYVLKEIDAHYSDPYSLTN